jgi:hypothetical protein
MSNYKMGWGWDILFPAICFINQRPVIRDYAYTIDHPAGTNYNKDQAEREMHALYTTLDDEVKQAFRYIKTDFNKLAEYYVEKEMTVAIVSCHNQSYIPLANLTDWEKNTTMARQIVAKNVTIKDNYFCLEIVN